jgi:hypothetical protein
MPRLATSDPDITQFSISLAVLLSDAYRADGTVLGKLTVETNLGPAYRKIDGRTFVFYRLPAGANTVKVTSAEDPPYYQPVTIAVVIPMPDPGWPAFPDRSIAQSNPAGYQQQVTAATLRPTTTYPFPENATLARGRVLAAGVPLAGATVRRDGANPGLEYVTGADGEYVLFFDRVQGAAENLKLRASAAGHADALANVQVVRGETVSADIAI